MMSQNNYQQQATAGATGVELVLALYDAALRFLYRAVESVESGEVRERRVAVKRVVEILMYLQARLRMDVGGTPAAALSEFYSEMFTMTLEASHASSKAAFQEVIGCVRNVREAWVIVARDPVAGRVLPRELRTSMERFVPHTLGAGSPEAEVRARWSA